MALAGEYALHRVTIGMIRSHSACLAVHRGGDHDPLPETVVAELRALLDDQAADFQAQILARQAAYADEVRRHGRIIA